MIFGVLLALTFLCWYRTERTLSIHSIVTRRRESFYYLAVTKADVITTVAARDADAERGGRWQTALVLRLILVGSGTGYLLRTSALRQHVVPTPVAAPGAPGQRVVRLSTLGDLSSFQKITRDTLDRLNAGDQSGSTTRVADLETGWDNAEARLRPRDPTSWTRIDKKIDKVRRELRSTSPTPNSEKAALTALLAALG